MTPSYDLHFKSTKSPAWNIPGIFIKAYPALCTVTWVRLSARIAATKSATETIFNAQSENTSEKQKQLQEEMRRALTLLKGVIDVEERQMISVNVSESHLRFVRLLLHFRRSNKALWD